MKKYKFLDERKFRFLCQGLTLTSKSMDVLDHALINLDKTIGIPTKIITHNQKNGFGPPPPFTGQQVIIDLYGLYSTEKGKIFIAEVNEHKEIINIAPALHINLHSPYLDIPQRVEIPLRYILKGLPNFDNTYMVYLHVIKMEDGKDYVYYGITKRGWMKRFNEHMSSALQDRSPLLFHRTLREGILGRLTQINGKTSLATDTGENVEKILVGNHHVICAAGLTEEQALELEEYLVDKYSFSHSIGLNMIPGGKAGISYLHKLNALRDDVAILVDEDREKILKKYIEDHPRKGMPNPLVSQYWNDSDYAAKVICGRDGRLSVEQVQLIREAALEGLSVGEIRELINANNDHQVRRVLDGKTYVRIH
jgi:hypothetical protein